MLGAPKPLVHLISSPWSIRFWEHGYENCHQLHLSEGTYSETKRQDVVLGGPTKSFLDETVQALGTEVEPAISEVKEGDVQFLPIFLLLFLGQSVLGLGDFKFAFTK